MRDVVKPVVKAAKVKGGAGSVPGRAWLMRTYAGHSSARASNALFRANLARGQTGLSVAFDLPTQTGYDADHPLARGEVGKVGVPVGHIGDMEALFEGVPLETMNTSMTINATAPWLLALYVALARRRGVAPELLAGTTQNDIVKEYLSRGTFIFPPEASLKLTTDVILHTSRFMPKWNPLNICSYHLQEAGATLAEEVAYALSNACGVLDMVKGRAGVSASHLSRIVGRFSFFLNSGIRIVGELCKLRVFARLWDEIARKRYGVAEERLRRFRYGVQVNSLGLTEQQPENNVYRILLGMLPVVLSAGVRARAVQLPAWNEALGLPRPWDQQWSLRLQQIVAYETDILSYGDIFAGSHVLREQAAALEEEVRGEFARVEEMGGVVAAVTSGYIKGRLVRSNARRLLAIERGERKVVGVNCYEEGLPSPLTDSSGASIFAPDAKAESGQIAALKVWRAKRDGGCVESSLAALRAAALGGENIMASSIGCAEAGVTTGEWADCMRGVFGEYRAPTGLEGGVVSSSSSVAGGGTDGMARARDAVMLASKRVGRRLKMLVGKPGLDGHSNGAEQIALRARDAGFEVVYEGIRLTPERIVNSALEEGVHVVGLSILSGSHGTLVADVLRLMKVEGLGGIPVVVGGIIPARDAVELRKLGVAAVYTPRDFDVSNIMVEIAGLAERGSR